MITSTQNPRVKWVRALKDKRQARWDEGRFLLEGSRLAYEALATEAPVDLVLHTENLRPRERGLVNSLLRRGAQGLLVSPGVMKACSSLDTPPGILLVVRFPLVPAAREPGFVLVADGLADPGNLGTLLRSAWAAGVEQIYVTRGSVDPYHPRVVRGAMGAHLHLPIAVLHREEARAALEGLDVWVAMAGEGEPYTHVDWTRPVALIIGGEARGAKGWLDLPRARAVHIPMPGAADSLNAAMAGTLLLFEVPRRRAGT
jgi:TrmH family RNA methyltransferase